jgi:hypothetical protein
MAALSPAAAHRAMSIVASPALPPIVPCALALELRPGAQPAHAGLAQATAARLADHLAADLARLLPEAQGLDLVLAAAHFDPAELLRPGWPLHRRLLDLHARAPRTGASAEARVIVFGADADGVLPQPLCAEPTLLGGALRVLPFALTGTAETVAAVALRCEEILLERGMAGAATALTAQEGFAVPVEHARYLTAHDLAAMTALQYEHAGLAPLWPLIEAALLSPQRETWLDAPPEPLLRYADGRVRIATLDRDAWRARYAAQERDPARVERGYGYFMARIRQLRAVLDAHAIDNTESTCAPGDDAYALLNA